jgi:hypothetical protein
VPDPVEDSVFVLAGELGAVRLPVSSAGQLGASMAALDFEIPAELRALLDDASAVPPASVYRMFTPGYQNWIVSPGLKIGDKPTGYAPAVRSWERTA